MAEPAPSVHIETGKSFSLKAGQSARSGDDALRVGFEGVTADSRCPKGAQCIWAGDAIARVWVQQGSGRRETRELHVAPGPAQAMRVLDLEVRLVRLDPYPVTGKPIAKENYVATLTLGRDPAVVPDR